MAVVPVRRAVRPALLGALLCAVRRAVRPALLGAWLRAIVSVVSVPFCWVALDVSRVSPFVCCEVGSLLVAGLRVVADSMPAFVVVPDGSPSRAIMSCGGVPCLVGLLDCSPSLAVASRGVVPCPSGGVSFGAWLPSVRGFSLTL